MARHSRRAEKRDRLVKSVFISNRIDADVALFVAEFLKEFPTNSLDTKVDIQTKRRRRILSNDTNKN